jgi:predicted MFS family arabinose efflux permease
MIRFTQEHTRMKVRFSGLWKHPDFLKLWFGQTVSQFGSHITSGALPLIAVLTLDATPAQMGLLSAAGALPVLLFSLFIGVWVDRLRRRPLMIAADLGRFVLLLLVPVAAFSGALRMEMLYIVAALGGLLGVVFDVSYRSMLPTLVTREHLLEGNTRLATTESLAEVGGPPLSGLLVQLVSGPLAVLFDAFSFLVSILSLLLIRTPEPPPAPPEDREPVLAEIAGGFRALGQHPAVRVLVTGTAIRAFFGSMIGALYSLYVVRELGLSPAMPGLLTGAGGIGALIGAGLSARMARRFGLGRTLAGTVLVAGSINLLLPFAGGSALLAAGLLFATQLFGDAAWAIHGIQEMSLRQTLIPDRLLGRANAGVGFLVGGVAPLGAVVGGWLATHLGVRETLLVAVLGILSTGLWALFSPVRRLETRELTG